LAGLLFKTVVIPAIATAAAGAITTAITPASNPRLEPAPAMTVADEEVMDEGDEE